MAIFDKMFSKGATLQSLQKFETNILVEKCLNWIYNIVRGIFQAFQKILISQRMPTYKSFKHNVTKKMSLKKLFWESLNEFVEDILKIGENI